MPSASQPERNLENRDDEWKVYLQAHGYENTKWGDQETPDPVPKTDVRS